MSSIPNFKGHDILQAAIQIHNEGLKKELQEFMHKHIALRDSVMWELGIKDEFLDSKLEIFKEIMHIISNISIENCINVTWQ